MMRKVNLIAGMLLFGTACWQLNNYASLVDRGMMLRLLDTLQQYKTVTIPSFPSDEELESLWYHVNGSVEEINGRNSTERVVSVHSAHYSRRGGHVKVIIASDAASLIKRNNWPFSHQCGFYDNGLNLIRSVPATFYTRYLIHCPFNLTLQHVLPTRLSIFRNASKTDIANPVWTIPIHDYEKLVVEGYLTQQDLAVCVKIFYGSPNWLLFLQFMEYYRLQGVAKFFVKIRSQDLSPFMDRILEYYSDLGLVHIKRWDINYPFCGKSEKWCQMNQINECVTRNAHLFRYVLVCDYDEIVRTSNSSLTILDLIQKIDRPNIGAFTFTAKYLVTNRTELGWDKAVEAVKKGSEETDALLAQELPWRVWRNVTGPVSRHYSPKTIVKPEAVKKMWVHFARVLYPGYSSHSIHTENEGYFMHFKNTTRWAQAHHPWKWTKYKLEKELPKDEVSMVKRIEANIKIALTTIVNAAPRTP